MFNDEIKKINLKKKQPKLNRANFQYPWPEL